VKGPLTKDQRSWEGKTKAIALGLVYSRLRFPIDFAPAQPECKLAATKGRFWRKDRGDLVLRTWEGGVSSNKYYWGLGCFSFFCPDLKCK